MEIFVRTGKIREEIRKPDTFPGKNIIISFLRCKLNILSRNVVKTVENLRFEKNIDENGKKEEKK